MVAMRAVGTQGGAGAAAYQALLRAPCCQTNFAIQTVKDTQTTVEAMKTAAVTLREEQKKIDIDDIEVRTWSC